MTKEEIRIVLFIMLALLVGAGVKAWQGRALDTLPPAPAPAPKGWAKPPYIYKSPKEARDAHARSTE